MKVKIIVNKTIGTNAMIRAYFYELNTNYSTQLIGYRENQYKTPNKKDNFDSNRRTNINIVSLEFGDSVFIEGNPPNGTTVLVIRNCNIINGEEQSQPML